MNKEKIIDALIKLEQAQHNPNGYGAEEVLNVLNIAINAGNKKLVRTQLRSLISKQLYPEFKTAGNDDIVYCPNGKSSGLYRLSDYREPQINNRYRSHR